MQPTGGFTQHLRPRPRVRTLDADDLAVLDVPDWMTKDWLIDSSGLLCFLCGARMTQPEGALAHREGCHRE